MIKDITRKYLLPFEYFLEKFFSFLGLEHFFKAKFIIHSLLNPQGVLVAVE